MHKDGFSSSDDFSSGAESVTADNSRPSSSAAAATADNSRPSSSAAMLTGPVVNPQYILVGEEDEMDRREWKDVEMKHLRKGMELQYRKMMLKKSIYQLSGPQVSLEDAFTTVSSLRDLEVTPQMLREFLPKVDWNKLASSSVIGRSGPECSQRTDWTDEEDKKMLSIVKEKGPYNWPDIAAFLGTNRTPFACLQRYQRNFNENIQKREWTDEEDAQLYDAVEESGERNWQAVAAKLECRTGPICSSRWEKLVDQSKKEMWTPEEDKILENDVKFAVRFYGTENWNKIAEHMPGRTAMCCRRRWEELVDQWKKEKWTPEEDRRLEIVVKVAVRFYGREDWNKIAEHMPGRTAMCCRERWVALDMGNEPIQD